MGKLYCENANILTKCLLERTLQLSKYSVISFIYIFTHHSSIIPMVMLYLFIKFEEIADPYT